MKICLLGDTHFGARNDSKVFHAYYENFYSNVLFPYLKDNGVKTIIQLGDLFDRRKYINFVSLRDSRRYFFDKLEEHGIHLHALIGNHDIFWKNSLEVNSPDLLLRDYHTITLYQKEQTVNFDGLMIDIVPWLCDENEEQILQFIKKSTSPICVGHFELAGFPLLKGVDSQGGHSSEFLDKYDAVFSGHYHTQSHIENIRYIGTPYELTWSDYNDPKGFFILDTETQELTFVENPLNIFHKIFYDDSSQEFKLDDIEKYKDTYVKVVVLNKQNPYLFDKMLDELYNIGPADVSIVEDFTDTDLEDTDEELVNQAEDTLTILSNYIDQQEMNVKASKLKGLMRELYIEALSTENIE